MDPWLLGKRAHFFPLLPLGWGWGGENFTLKRRCCCHRSRFVTFHRPTRWWVTWMKALHVPDGLVPGSTPHIF